MVPVRPDWHEPSDLLGYVSRIGGHKYIATDFLKFIVKAWQEIPNSSFHPQIEDMKNVRTYWLCLDEMNLAPVEQYFADYLSILETRVWKNGEYSCDPILKSTIFTDLLKVNALESFWESIELPIESPWAAEFLKNGIPLPPNLIVAGTVNMDETTHQFSRKVIDRALTLDFGEFFPNDYTEYVVGLKYKPKTLTYGTTTQAVYHDNEGKPLFQVDQALVAKSNSFLNDINTNVLKGTPFELAYRALNELLITVHCFAKTDGSNLPDIWDDYLMMKVLPRIEGDEERLGKILDNLLVEVQKHVKTESGERHDLFREDYAGNEIPCEWRSVKMIAKMQERLKLGYTSFWP